MAWNNPRRAVAGWKVFDPGWSENSALRRDVDDKSMVSRVGGGACWSEAVSTDRGFFFDVTDVQSDMALRFRFKVRRSLGVVFFC